jgi:hypothetical protein
MRVIEWYACQVFTLLLVDTVNCAQTLKCATGRRVDAPSDHEPCHTPLNELKSYYWKKSGHSFPSLPSVAFGFRERTFSAFGRGQATSLVENEMYVLVAISFGVDN